MKKRRKLTAGGDQNKGFYRILMLFWGTSPQNHLLFSKIFLLLYLEITRGPHAARKTDLGSPGLQYKCCSHELEKSE